MSQHNVGPYILAGCIALAVGMGILAGAIRDAGTTVSSGAGYAGANIENGLNNFRNGTGNGNFGAGDRYRIFKADAGLIDGGEAYWVFDMAQQRVKMYQFVKTPVMIEQHLLYDNSLK